MELVPAAIESYCEAHTSAPSPLLAEIHAYTTRNCAYPQMLIGPLEAAFLQLLVRVSGVRRILEIGTFTGYSALAMAEALPDDGRLMTCEVDPEHAAIASAYFKRSEQAHRIELRLGPALDTIRVMPEDPVFDLVFIDADKGNYVNYYEAVLPRLRRGGLVVADNVLWSGRVLDPREPDDHAIVRFNAHVYADARVQCVLLPLRDGVSVIRKV